MKQAYYQLIKQHNLNIYQTKYP